MFLSRAESVSRSIAVGGNGFLAVYVAGDDPLDTFVVHHPEAVFELAVEEVGPWQFHGIEVKVLGERIGDASGLKMCYAALTKGLQSLGTELLVAARLMDLEDVLADVRSQMYEPCYASYL